jgi:hypothetical protein
VPITLFREFRVSSDRPAARICRYLSLECTHRSLPCTSLPSPSLSLLTRNGESLACRFPLHPLLPRLLALSPPNFEETAGEEGAILPTFFPGPLWCSCSFTANRVGGFALPLLPHGQAEKGPLDDSTCPPVCRKKHLVINQLEGPWPLPHALMPRCETASHEIPAGLYVLHLPTTDPGRHPLVLLHRLQHQTI